MIDIRLEILLEHEPTVFKKNGDVWGQASSLADLERWVSNLKLYRRQVRKSVPYGSKLPILNEKGAWNALMILGSGTCIASSCNGSKGTTMMLCAFQNTDEDVHLALVPEYAWQQTLVKAASVANHSHSSAY